MTDWKHKLAIVGPEDSDLPDITLGEACEEIRQLHKAGERLRAENERLQNAVRKLLACPAIADGNHNEPAYYDAETVEAEREGRAALERKPE